MNYILDIGNTFENKLQYKNDLSCDSQLFIKQHFFNRLLSFIKPPGSHCVITNCDSFFDAQIEPFSSATISNMFDIVALGDRNLKVIAQCEPSLKNKIVGNAVPTYNRSVFKFDLIV